MWKIRLAPDPIETVKLRQAGFARFLVAHGLLKFAPLATAVFTLLNYVVGKAWPSAPWLAIFFVGIGVAWSAAVWLLLPRRI